MECGVVNKFLTIFEDFNMAYLFGIQMIDILKNIKKEYGL